MSAQTTPRGPAMKKALKRGSPWLSTTHAWRGFLSSKEAVENVLANDLGTDELLKQLVSCLKPPNGVLATAPPELRSELLQFVHSNCVKLFAASSDARLRTVYESLKDHIVNPKTDSPSDAARLQETSIIALTEILIKINAPERDLRLLKTHVGLLYRMFDSRGLEATSIIAKRVYSPKALAAECLCSLEKAFPTLLISDAGALLYLARNGANEFVDGAANPSRIQLVATVLGNACDLYHRQQHQSSNSNESGVFSSTSSVRGTEKFSSNGENYSQASLVKAAANALAAANPSVHSSLYISTEAARAATRNGSRTASASATPRCMGLSTTAFASDCILVPDGASLGAISLPLAADSASSDNENDVIVQPKTYQDIDTSEDELPSPTAVVATVSRNFAASVASTNTGCGSQNNMAETLAAEEASASTSTSRLKPSSSSPPLVVSTTAGGLTTALSLSRSAAAQSSIDLEACTPRTIESVTSMLHSGQLPIIRPETGPLRRVLISQHFSTGDINDAPTIVMTPDAQRALQTASIALLGSLRRLPPSTAAEVGEQLLSIVRVASPPQTELWPAVERLLMARNTPLLKAVLTFYDALPEMFEGRGPALMEKVLGQINDPNLSSDHRLAAASWVLRSHASSVHGGTALLLADGWDRLLLRPDDSAALAAIKVKVLASCLSAGVGDPSAVCSSVCSWEGFGGVYGARKPTDQQLRSLTYTLRLLRGVTCPDPGSTHRMHACLAAGVVHLMTVRPTLAPAVETFIQQMDGDFSGAVLAAFDALFSAVDGQFEVLLATAEDEIGGIEDSQRAKAALVSRSSSLSGLLRGLSFSLSFTKRAASVLPESSRQVPRPVSGGRMAFGLQRATGQSFRSTASATVTQRPRVDVSALRSSVMNVFDNSPNLAGASSGRFGGGLAPVQEGGIIPARPTTFTQPATLNHEAPAPPIDIESWEAAAAWLGSKATWEDCATSLLGHDLMAYRGLMHLVLAQGEAGRSKGTLQILANYSWQYKYSHSSHVLPAKQTGAAILGLCHSVVIRHLLASPLATRVNTAAAAKHNKKKKAANGNKANSEWTESQRASADAVRTVLDALEEGFPVVDIRERAKALGELLENKGAWTADARGDTLETMLKGYIGAAVQG